MQKTHVVMLLDESSSMIPHREAVVDTFNQYTSELKGTKRVWLSLFKFAGNHSGGFQSRSMERRIVHQSGSVLKKVFENRKLKDTYPLTTPQYTPNGWTPLYDAIGSLIQQTKKRLPKDAKVLFVIHTDGQENTSTEYNMERIKTLIQRMEKKRGWTFIYLGEGSEAWNAGYDFGIDNVANFSSTMRGQAMDKLAVGTQCYAANTSVGGAAGSTKTFYHDANLEPDDVDPEETLKTTSWIIKPASQQKDAWREQEQTFEAKEDNDPNGELDFDGTNSEAGEPDGDDTSASTTTSAEGVSRD